MLDRDPYFELRLAQSAEDILGAQRLRYRVFVRELGGDGPLVDHEAEREQDRFDPFFDHLILVDTRLAPPDHVVGVYRLLLPDQAVAAGQYYSEDEYDLDVLQRSGRRCLELGRSCVDRAYRGGTAMMHLWAGLADYVETHRIDVLFGVARFHGTDVEALSNALSFLHHNHLAPPELRVRAKPAVFQPMDLRPKDQIDRRAAMVATPSLIKGYLRLGGVVGEGAFVDHAFNTTDVCLIMDTQKMNARQKALYARAGA